MRLGIDRFVPCDRRPLLVSRPPNQTTYSASKVPLKAMQHAVRSRATFVGCTRPTEAFAASGVEGGMAGPRGEQGSGLNRLHERQA